MAFRDRNIVDEENPSTRKNHTRFLTLVPKGYTARGAINGFPLMVTGCNLSLGTNVVKGQGVMPIYQGGDFRRIQGNAFRDYPVQTLNITCEATEGIFSKLIVPAYKEYFVNPFEIEFEDEANGIRYHYNDALPTNCHFAVSTEEAIEVSFDFNIYRDGFFITSQDRTSPDMIYSKENTERFIKDIVGNKLLGYYHFGVEYSGFDDIPLTAFSIDFSRDLTPKFGCVGEDDLPSARRPMKIIFGPPSVSYSLTYLLVEKTLDDIYSDGIHSYRPNAEDLNESNRIVIGPSNDDGKTLSVWFAGDKMLEFTNCYPNSYSPQVGNKDDVPRLEISGEVYGKINT